MFMCTSTWGKDSKVFPPLLMSALSFDKKMPARKCCNADWEIDFLFLASSITRTMLSFEMQWRMLNSICWQSKKYCFENKDMYLNAQVEIFLWTNRGDEL